MTGSRSAATRRPQSMRARSPSLRRRSCTQRDSAEATAGTVECSARCRETAEGWRPRGADRSAVVRDRGLARSGPTVRHEGTVKAGGGHRDAAAPRRCNHRGSRKRHGVAAAHGPRSLLGNPEEEAGACACFGEGGARPGLPHRRAGERMMLPTHDTSARQHTGGPAPVPGRGGNRNDRARKPGLSDIEAEIAGLLDRSTQELRLAWRKLHRTEPPLGISRDLLIRSLASELQQCAHGGPNLALRRRLQSLARASERSARSVDPGVVLKTGATLVRQWRGHAHTVLVREDGFEYEGQHYRSLTVIAER